MVGTGALARPLIAAHRSVRPLRHLRVWGRSPAKAQAIVNDLAPDFETAQVVEDLEQALGQADLISAATMTVEPLIRGRCLKPGTHVDLVGAYRPHMREADDDAIERSRIYIDTPMALHEAGELKIPLERGLLTTDQIQGDLFQLCRGQVAGRAAADEITLFKSVGYALEDLVAAEEVVANS